MNFNWTDMLNKMIDFFIKIIFGLVFILLITPVGILLRAVGIDYLNRMVNYKATSYWNKHD